MNIRKPSYEEFLNRLKRKALMCGFRYKVLDRLYYRKSSGEKLLYPYVQVTSNDMTKPIFIIRAAIHGGHEYAGSITILRHLHDIANLAQRLNISLVIFPLDNPSGYECDERYNVANDTGSGGNNDGMRYILPSGKMVGILEGEQPFSSWLWSSDPSLKQHLAEETIVLHCALKQLPLENVRAILDIHQDRYQVSPGTYFYAYGDSGIYKDIIRKIERYLPVYKNENLMSPKIATKEYFVLYPEEVDALMLTDQFGCVLNTQDGSIPALLWELGADHAVTPETSTAASFQKCDLINLAWIYGLMHLMSKGISARTK